MQCDTESIAAIVAGIVLILNTVSTIYTNILTKRHEFRTQEIKAAVDTNAVRTKELKDTVDTIAETVTETS